MGACLSKTFKPKPPKTHLPAGTKNGKILGFKISRRSGES